MNGRLDLENRSISSTHSARWWLLVVIVVFVVTGVHLAGRVASYCCTIEADDSYIYASFGYRIAHGDVLYHDMSDIKPPGLYLLYALVYLVAPAGRSSIVGIESLFMLLGYCAIYRLSVEMYGRAAAIMVVVLGVLAINYFTVSGFAICGFGVAENFMVLPAAAAVLFYRRGCAGRGLAPLLLAGVFMGMDSCIKQTALPLVIAIVLHFSITSLVVHRSIRRWLVGVLLLFGGGCIGWMPAGLVMVWQGTLGDAYALLTDGAVTMLGRASAWPEQWRDVLPFWVPMVWSLWAATAWIERRWSRPVSGEKSTASSVGASDVFLLLLWCGLEMLLIAHLPLRSAHYYVVACVPFIVLSGLPLAVFADCVSSLDDRAKRAAWTFMVIGSAVFMRQTVDEIVPRAISTYGSHDWAEEDRRFKDAINWGPIHFGRGPPFLSDEYSEHTPSDQHLVTDGLAEIGFRVPHSPP